MFGFFSFAFYPSDSWSASSLSCDSFPWNTRVRATPAGWRGGRRSDDSRWLAKVISVCLHYCRSYFSAAGWQWKPLFMSMFFSAFYSPAPLQPSFNEKRLSFLSLCTIAAEVSHLATGSLTRPRGKSCLLITLFWVMKHFLKACWAVSHNLSDKFTHIDNSQNSPEAWNQMNWCSFTGCHGPRLTRTV